MNPTHERRPHEGAATRAGRPETRVGDTADLARMTPRAQAIWCEAYAVGYEHGIAEGRRQVEAEDAAAWARMRVTIHAAAKGDAVDFAKVSERRGDHERAGAIRRLWQERGIGLGAVPVIICAVCHTPTSPLSCSCGYTRADRGLS